MHIGYGTDATLLYYRLGLLIRTSTLHGETGPCESHFIKETSVYLCRHSARIRACIATYSVGWEAGPIPHAVLLYQCMHGVANKAYAWLYYLKKKKKKKKKGKVHGNCQPSAKQTQMAAAKKHCRFLTSDAKQTQLKCRLFTE